MKKYTLALLFASTLSVASNIACAQLTDDQAGALQKKAETGDAQALTTLRQEANQGDAKAQYILGFMYEFGRGVPQDYGEAVKWFHPKK